MFSPLTPADVVIAIGRAARGAVREENAHTDYGRGQLLSAYSSARHLAVELRSYDSERLAFAADVAAWTRESLDDDGAAEVSERLEQAADAHELGEATCVLLERLRSDGSEPAIELLARIRARLRALADREVELLADVIEAPRKR